MASKTLTKTLEEMQLKISEYSLAEAKAKKEKAEVELETAKIHQAYLRESWEMELAARSNNSQGGTKN